MYIIAAYKRMIKSSPFGVNKQKTMMGIAPIPGGIQQPTGVETRGRPLPVMNSSSATLRSVPAVAISETKITETSGGRGFQYHF
jgi:hypothetical protein